MVGNLSFHPIPPKIVDPVLLQQIGLSLFTLTERAETLKAEIAALQADGCINGYLVEEWRKHKEERLGPYYRLHFYVTLPTREQTPPQYIGAAGPKVDDVRRKIENHARYYADKTALEEIETALQQVKKSFTQINAYLEMRTTQFKQAQLL